MTPANGVARQDHGLFGPDTVASKVIGHRVAHLVVPHAVPTHDAP